MNYYYLIMHQEIYPGNRTIDFLSVYNDWVRLNIPAGIEMSCNWTKFQTIFKEKYPW